MDTLTLTETRYNKYDWVNVPKEEYLKKKEEEFNIALEIQQTNNKAELINLSRKYDFIKSNNYAYYAVNKDMIPNYLTQEEFNQKVKDDLESDVESLFFVKGFLPITKKDDDDLRKKVLIYRKIADRFGCYFCFLIVALFLVVVIIMFLHN
jgi:hypothetical protein